MFTFPGESSWNQKCKWETPQDVFKWTRWHVSFKCSDLNICNASISILSISELISPSHASQLRFTYQLHFSSKWSENVIHKRTTLFELPLWKVVKSLSIQGCLGKLIMIKCFYYWFGKRFSYFSLSQRFNFRFGRAESTARVSRDISQLSLRTEISCGKKWMIYNHFLAFKLW